MDSRQGDVPAIEADMSSGFCCALSSPITMPRRNISYDEHIYGPIHSPPSDMTVNILWKDPVIPQHKFRKLAEEGESCGKLQTLEAATPAKSPVPVVKAKATSLMSSLMIKQTQENIQRFEHQAGLTDAGYTPHKGLSAEETRFHRLGDGTLPKYSPLKLVVTSNYGHNEGIYRTGTSKKCCYKKKLRMPSGDFKDDRLTPSAQSTPSSTPTITPNITPCVSPHSSPAVSRRSWFQLGPVPLPATSQLNPNSSTDMGGNEGGGGEKWSFFGTRSVVQKSPTDPGSETSTGFSLQSYFGLQKSSTMDGTNTQINLKVEDPANFMPPKIEISDTEAKRAPPRPHKLKPRDMNVLTPSGF